MKTTDHVGCYIQIVPEIIERIGKVIGAKIAHLAQAFAGVIVKDQPELEAAGGSQAPTSAAYVLTLRLNRLEVAGSTGFLRRVRADCVLHVRLLSSLASCAT